jgi:UDP:flavonoid glycosyltransferase YjiC (YdhE family)
VLAALGRGLPMVGIPMIGDQPLIADRVAGYGAALSRAPTDPLGPAVATVLNEPGYRHAAQKAAELLATAAGPTTVWKQLRAQLRPASAR